MAGELFFSPVRTRVPQSEKLKAIEARKDIHFVHNRKVSVYIWNPLATKKVLFVHGWSGRGTQVTPFLDELIENGYGVIAFDAPGHGDSRHKKSDLFQIEETVRFVLSQYHVDSIIAHSLGGLATLLAQEKLPAVSRQILIGVPASIDYIIESFCLQLGAGEVVKNYMTKILVEDYRIDRLQRLASENTEEIEHLIVHDRNDRAVSFEQGFLLSKRLSNSTMVPTNALGHNGILRDSEVISNCVQFLNGEKVKEPLLTL